jgi:YD repeat-containing protein
MDLTGSARLVAQRSGKCSGCLRGGRNGRWTTFLKGSLMVCRPSHHCGDAFRTVDAPYLGTPAIEQQAGPGPCCAERPAGETQPPVMSLADCPPCPGPLPGALDEVADALRAVQERFRLNIPGILDGPVAINIASRNLVLKTALPTAGPFYPQNVLTYNAHAPRRCIPYSAGWTGLFNQTVRVHCANSKNACVIKGDGSCWRYTDLDSTGYYLAPPGAANSLQRTEEGWVETQPDGLELHYEEFSGPHVPSGLARLVKLQRHSQIWTLTYGDTELVSIQDPLGRSTTYAYSDRKLQTITDHAGRVTRFTIEDNRLTRIVPPEEDCEVNLEYDRRCLLRAYVDPAGNRYTYTYDGCKRVESTIVTEPV